MRDVRKLIDGYVDIHVHAGPSLIPRELDAWELVAEGRKGSVSAFVIKDHHMPTMGIAKIIQDHMAMKDLDLFGSICLNNSVGGIDALVAEVAVGYGARIVWMPTVSSQNHIAKHKGTTVRYPFPGMDKMSVVETPITVIDGDGRLTEDASRVLQVLAKYPGVVLATGHGNRDEVDAMVRQATALGVKRILVDHPFFMVEATIEDVETWHSLGAYIEFTAVSSVPASKYCCVPIQRVAEVIKKLGPNRIILSSDYGQKGNGSPVVGMIAFVELLLLEGVDEKSILQILRENSRDLLGM